MKRRPATRKSNPGRQVSDIYSWPAPVKGWFDSESIADMPEGSAFRLDNWFPESTSLKMRPGFTLHAQIVNPGELEIAATALSLRTIAPQRRSIINEVGGGLVSLYGSNGVTGG